MQLDWLVLLAIDLDGALARTHHRLILRSASTSSAIFCSTWRMV
jgi:hypothetical protein